MQDTVPRRTIVGAFDPAAVFEALFDGRDDVFWLDSGPDGISYLGEGSRLDVSADTVWDTLRAVPASGHLGVVGWLGYELRAATTGATVGSASRYPDAAFLAVDRVIAIDTATGAAEIIGEPSTWSDSLRALDGIAGPAPVAPEPARAVWHDTDDEYLDAIAACQDAIREGEAYLLCLTNEAEVAGTFDPFQVRLRLRSASPSHHGALIRIGGISMLSSSPEQFLVVSPDGDVATRPIKGTRMRGKNPSEDADQIHALRESEKERAENLMIVDLMRNDLSRVCELGTVTVTELLEVESYPQVHQLVSTVVGHLRPGLTAVDALEAAFPAGSMTGTPKLRATQLLDSLERRARGLYSGCFGYLAADGRADFAMTIRTIVLDADGATVGAGGGITALSVPGEELFEVKVKARAPLAALGA
ncbi:MAG: anthranilate synthase component I family protein [Pseudolysinimonas sp.]